MHRHVYKIAPAAIALLLCLGGYRTDSADAAQPAAVDTIVLETEAASAEDVPVDIKWKRSQEGGKWIESLSVAQDVNSLVLVLNDEQAETPVASAAVRTENSKVKGRAMEVNSRLLYYTKSADGTWQEVFSQPGETVAASCGGTVSSVTQDELYGVYRASEAFGSHENPGSLVPYQKLTEKDYLILDEESEQYGTIVTAGPKGPQTEQAVLLESMKALSNYGMLLCPEDEEEPYPALVVNCQQEGSVEGTLAGIQIPQNYVQMLIQSVDSNTRIVIAADVIDLEGM